MKAMLTGSRVYGTPGPDSDVDLIICYDTNAEYGILSTIEDMRVPEECQDYTALPDKDKVRGYGPGSSKLNLRLGKLNLIVVSKQEYEAWNQGTELLKSIKPTTKEVAIAVFEGLRRKLLPTTDEWLP